MGKKRKGNGQKEDSNGTSKRRKGSFAQKGQLSGPGILLTTIRRKERKAGLELIEFLDDLVIDLYPDLDLSIPEPRSFLAEPIYDEDDDLDALKNGVPSAATTQKEVQLEAQVKVNKDDDIEAQLQAELEELRPKDPKLHQNGNGSISDEGIEANKSVRKKFSLIDPEVECLMFVSVAWPMDPVQLCCALLDRVSKTGQVRGHFIQRLSPIYLTGRADGVERIEELANEVVMNHFPKSSIPLSYKVEPRIRLHNQLQRMDVIKAVASAVLSPHHADLNKPDLIINVEILKMTIGIGILPRYEEYKRYNPQMLAQKYNEEHNKSDSLTSRTLLPSHEEASIAVRN